MGLWNVRAWAGRVFGGTPARPDIEHLLPNLPDEVLDERETWSLHRYTPGARQLIGRAQTLADEAHHAEVTPLHLARRLLDLQAIQNVVKRNGADLHQCMKQFDEALSKLGYAAEPAYLSRELVAALRRAERKAAASEKVSVANVISTLDDGSDPRLEQLLALCVTQTPGNGSG